MRAWLVTGLLLAGCSGEAQNASPGNAGTALPAQAAPPGAVTSVRADSFIQAIFVSWDEPPGGTVTGYVVQDLGGSSQAATADRRLAYFDGLIGGSTHCFQVYALNGASRGPAEPQPTCAKAYASTIAPPTNVRATPIPRGAHVTWDPPVSNVGEPIASWQVVSVPYAARGGAPASVNSADVVGLEEGKTYTFRVSAWADGPAISTSVDVESNPVTIATVWPAGTWHQAASLPDPSAQAAFVLGGRLYAVGTEKIYVSPLEADGRPSSWSVGGSSRGVGFGSSSAYVAVPSRAGGYLYVTGGGDTMRGNDGSVWVARIGEDGSVGAFAKTSSILPGPKLHAAVADGGHLYVLGGFWWSGGSFTGVGTNLPFVQVADISGDGTLGTWRRVAFLPRAAQRLSAAVSNHRLYVLSHHGGGIDVMFAPLQPDGGVGSWRRATAQPAQASELFSLATAGGRLYLLGGIEPSNAVRMGQIGADGDVISWDESAADAFNGPRSSPAIALTDTRAYLMSGFREPFYDVQWTQIDPTTGHFAPVAPPAQPRPPDPPLHVRATAGNATATVRWDPPANDGGLPIAGYSVTAFLNALVVAHADVDATATTVTLTGLQNDLAYTFDVAARNSAGAGAGTGPTDDVVPAASPKWRPVPQVRIDNWYLQDPFLAGDVLIFFGMGRAAVPLDPAGMPWGQIGPGYVDDNLSSGHSWATATRQIDATTTCAYGVGGSVSFQSTGGVWIDCVRGDGFFGEAVASPPRSASGLQPTRMNGAAVIVGQFLYALGGTNRDIFDGPMTDLADVSFAPLAPDGSLGTWQHTAALPAAIAAPMAVAHAGDLYVLVDQGLLRATPAADGTITGWRTAGAPMPAAPGARLAIAGDLLYSVSPQGVLRGRLDGGGDIASWESDPADGPGLKAVWGLAARPDRLYLWGDRALFVAQIDPATGRLALMRDTAAHGKDWERAHPPR